MSQALGLHTFARRYCIDRIEYWQEKYEPIAEAALRNLGGHRYTDKAYDVFPRYNVLYAILFEIESFDLEALPALDELAKVLGRIGYRASSDFTGRHESPIAEAAEQDERDRFFDVVETAAAAALISQEPLFYRRVLDQEQVADLRQNISKIWGVSEGYWCPLNDRTHPSLVAVQLGDVDRPRLERDLRKFLTYPCNERIYELREFGRDNYELDAVAAELHYNFAEGYWFPKSNDWIVYSSHEGTMTFGGTIAEIVRKRFPAAIY